MNSGNQLPNLDKIFRDDDEPDFLPSGGSNLAAIFGLQVKPPDSHSLSKQVSKKPSSPRNVSQTVSSKTEVIIAKAVHAFKLQNGTYVPVGKLGMALTGNIGTRVYQIILYKSKQEHVSTVTVTYDFLYIVQANNYSSYYDSNKDNWSILFENNDVCVEFAKEIGLARYFSKDKKLENVLYQDLSPINKDTVAKEGNNVSIKYFIASEITQPFKCNFATLQTMVVEISTDDNWEKTLIGSSKGLKRILFLPPSKQISLGPGFPKETDIVLDIEIIDIQAPEETSYSHKTASGKASIISRMAKMGQSMLPRIPTTTDSEDTEDDLPHKSPHHKKIEPLEGGLQNKHSSQESVDETSRNTNKILKPKSNVPVTNTTCKSFVPAPIFASQWSPTQMQPNFVTLDGQVYSLQPQSVTPTISSIIDPGLNMFLSESRMTNAELRMGMSKIADNVQKLLDKFHVLELQNATSPIKDKTALDAALKMLLSMNISQSGEKDSQPQTSTDNKITDDSPENQMKSIISTMKKECQEAKKALSATLEDMKNLEAQNKSLTEENENLRKNIQELKVSLTDVNSVLLTTKQDLEEAKNLNSKHEEQKLTLENRLSDLREKCNTLPSKMDDHRNREIKHIMNKTYHILMDKFVNESYPTSYIKSTIASTIKNITLQVLHNTSGESSKKMESESLKTAEINAPKAITAESTSDSNNTAGQLPKQAENINISPVLLRDEPPPIPPIDTEDDSDWLS
ncbi:FK506-binding protein 15 isoform X2 [Calliopsis andreniformis]